MVDGIIDIICKAIEVKNVRQDIAVGYGLNLQTYRKRGNRTFGQEQHNNRYWLTSYPMNKVITNFSILTRK